MSLNDMEPVMVSEKYASNYELIGGEPGVRKLSTAFYDAMETRDDAKDLLAMHGHDLTVIREKFFKFLSGWLGGPQLYMQEYGHPRLRMRHMPFPIDHASAVSWMACMNQALEETVEDAVVRRHLSHAFAHIAKHMVNKA